MAIELSQAANDHYACEGSIKPKSVVRASKRLQAVLKKYIKRPNDRFGLNVSCHYCFVKVVIVIVEFKNNGK